MTAPIYLDHHATTPCDPRVAEVVARALVTGFGNPSSRDHAIGDRAAIAVEEAAREVAALVGATPREVVFTSGATEALNLAISGTAETWGGTRKRILVSPTEHPAVLQTCRRLARRGMAEVHWLRVDNAGRLGLDQVEADCRAGAAMLCVMAANNEIGTIAPIAELAAIAERHGVRYVCDAAQAAGRVPLDVGEWGVDLLAVSAHKMYGPPGTGALVVQRGLRLDPILAGGSQERGLRPGTQNVPGIVGFGLACRLRRVEGDDDESAIAGLRDELQRQLLAALPDISVQGDPAARLAGNLHIAIPDVPNDAVIARLRERLAVSTGAACASGVPAPSHVLTAIGLSIERQHGAIRFGLGRTTTASEISEGTQIFLEAVNAARSVLANRRSPRRQ